MSVALRSSPLEDSIPYKKVIRSRQPKDRKLELPPSYWSKPCHACRYPVAAGLCGAELVGHREDCYYHEKIRSGLLVPLRGSLYVTNGVPDKMPPPQQTRKRAQHD